MNGSDLVRLAIAGMVVFSGVQTAVADIQYSFTTIDVPGALSTDARGINDSGQIVGLFSDATSLHGFLDSGGTFTTISFPGAFATVSDGINDEGQIVGAYQASTGGSTNQGFLYSNGSFSTIDVPGAPFTNALGINNSGQIVGVFTAAGSNIGHGFVSFMKAVAS